MTMLGFPQGTADMATPALTYATAVAAIAGFTAYKASSLYVSVPAICITLLAVNTIELLFEAGQSAREVEDPSEEKCKEEFLRHLRYNFAQTMLDGVITSLFVVAIAYKMTARNV